MLGHDYMTANYLFDHTRKVQPEDCKLEMVYVSNNNSLNLTSKIIRENAKNQNPILLN